MGGTEEQRGSVFGGLERRACRSCLEDLVSSSREGRTRAYATLEEKKDEETLVGVNWALSVIVGSLCSPEKP